MAQKTISESYELSNQNIDIIAVRIRDFLSDLGLERSNIIRIRLMMEEALLRWQDRFGSECSVKLNLDVRLRRPTITMELPGESFDPLVGEDELGVWADSLLSTIGLQPRYSYQRGANIVQLKLQRLRISPAITLICSVVFGLLLGLLGDYLLPEATQTAALEMVLDPIQRVFSRLLNAIAGPVIILSVLSAVCGVGNMADTGKSGRRLIVRFLLLSFVIAMLSSMVAQLAFAPRFTSVPLNGTGFNGTLDFFLQIIPNDMLTPIITGESPQLILVALMLGYALLSAGTQVGGLVAIVEQANTVALILADWIGRITPVFITLLLVLGLWDGSLSIMLGLWKPVLLFLVISVLFLLIRMLAVYRRTKVPLRKLAGKMKDSFLIAFRNASVDSSFGANQLCCERRLGINTKLLQYGLPLGLVIYMPAMTAAYMMVIVYLAQTTGITVSIIWYIMAELLMVTLLAATPPVTGVGLLTFSVLFTRLGIPDSALAAAMTADIICGFAVAALDQAMLQVELLLEADRLGQLNQTLLHK